MSPVLQTGGSFVSSGADRVVFYQTRYEPVTCERAASSVALHFQDSVVPPRVQEDKEREQCRSRG